MRDDLTQAELNVVAVCRRPYAKTWEIIQAMNRQQELRRRLDDELLSYAAKRLSEIRPEASPNREAGKREAANADGD